MDPKKFKEILPYLEQAMDFAIGRADEIVRRTEFADKNYKLRNAEIFGNLIVLYYEEYFRNELQDTYEACVALSDLTKPINEVVDRILEEQRQTKLLAEQAEAARKKQLEIQQQLERRKQYERLKTEFEPETHLEKE